MIRFDGHSRQSCGAWLDTGARARFSFYTCAPYTGHVILR